MNLNLFEDENDSCIQVRPIIDYSVRGLCSKPYPLHKKGCPNVNKCDRCPPKVGFFDKVFDMSKPVYAVVNEFDIGSHIQRMENKHPEWSYRQLRCVLYWQGTARKQLKEKVANILSRPEYFNYTETTCPEGMGVDVTKTMEMVDVNLEWPPNQIARQISFIGVLSGST